MREELNKKIKQKRNILRSIGIIEIIGGTTGIGLILWLLLQGFQTNSYILLIFIIAICFYIYSIFAGINLFRKKEKGILHSEILQFIQIIAFSLNGTTYLLTSGGNLFIGFNLANNEIELKLNFLASEFQLNLMSSEISNFVYINFFSVFILYLIGNSTRTIKTLNEAA